MPASKRFPCHAHRLHIAIMSVVKSPRAPSLASHAIISFCCLQQANNNSRSHSALHAYEHAADPETYAPLSFFYCARYIALENSFPTPPPSSNPFKGAHRHLPPAVPPLADYQRRGTSPSSTARRTTLSSSWLGRAGRGPCGRGQGGQVLGCRCHGAFVLRHPDAQEAQGRSRHERRTALRNPALHEGHDAHADDDVLQR